MAVATKKRIQLAPAFKSAYQSKDRYRVLYGVLMKKIKQERGHGYDGNLDGYKRIQWKVSSE